MAAVNYDDTPGQATSGKRLWPDGTPVAGQQFEYGFDDIGNSQFTAASSSWTLSLGTSLEP